MTKKKMIFIDVIIGILVAALIVGNCLAMTFSGIISIYLGQETWTTETVEGEADTLYFEGEFDTAKELRAAQEAFSQDLQAEATVLLQNSNNILPLDQGAQITLLGAGSAMDQFMAGGIGSGAIDTTSLKPLSQVFTDAGYGVNTTMIDFYAVGAGSEYRRASTQGIINECPVSEFTATEVNSFTDYGDAAIIIIGRESGEGAEIPKATEDDPNRTLLHLSAEELELVDYMYDGLAAGTDLWLNSAAGSWVFEGYDTNPTFMNLLRNACKNILYTVANSNAMNGMSANTKVVYTTPAWQKALIAVDVVAGVLLLAAAAWTFISYMKKNVLIYKDVDNTTANADKKAR